MDPLTIGMLAILAVLIFFMFRNSRKRKADQEKLREQIVPGVEIMTNFGLFGKLVSMDEVSNVAEVEVSPGTIVRVHRQTISKVVDETAEVAAGEPRSVEEAMAIANREAEERESSKAGDVAEAGEAKFGERIEAEPKKPVRRTPKKTDE